MKFKQEKLFGLLLAVTLTTICAKDTVLLESITLDSYSNGTTYSTFGYTDQITEGGNSEFIEHSSPLSWECVLQEGYEYPYCGYELLFDGQNRIKGIDMSNFHTIELDIAYEGPSDSIRVFFKNYDERYSDAAVRETAKFNFLEFRTRKEDYIRNIVSYSFEDVGVADWWKQVNNVEPSLARPQFDNIIALEIQNGTDATIGNHKFKIHSIHLIGSRYSDSEFFAFLLGVWCFVILLFLLYRTYVLTYAIRKTQLKYAIAHKRMTLAEKQAVTDNLTQLTNREGLYKAYKDLHRDRRMAQTPMSVVLLDIDKFKNLNDTYGHNAGDVVLSTVGRVLKLNSRDEDIVCRWGGEEFLVLCKGTDRNAAKAFAEKLRKAIEEIPFAKMGKVTASFGVHTFLTDSSVDLEGSLNHNVGVADVVMYTSKESGRNRVTLS
jgi:diguanylate cyclase (GGDEF)-like protein